ncbi:septum formation inhibitor Maf [Sulfurospirillum sp. 1612]|uniref:septum formation inhibitor Maf n=1 Tax=Sulfurospirillum sp. 1612 TaxID=3094835 RepID=UPI002F935ECA
MALILASTSPTRAMLLRQFGISFKQIAIDFDEDAIEATIPKDFVYLATKGKLEAYLGKHHDNNPVLCADTVICANGEILRKAKSRDEAREILLKQSDNAVSIISCLMYQSPHKKFIDISETRYLFMPFDMQKLEAYLNSGDWEGKAGACMVEGFCKSYIKKVEGLQSTAMGLSVERLLPFLESQDAV